MNFSNERKKAPSTTVSGCRRRLCYMYSWLATMPHLKWTSMPSSPTMICSTSCFMIMLSSAFMIAPLWMCSAKLSSHNFTSADADPPVFEAVSERPFLSFRIHLQVVLCDRCCDREEQFAGGLHGADLLFFEDDLDAEVTQFSHRFQKLHGVSCESGY